MINLDDYLDSPTGSGSDWDDPESPRRACSNFATVETVVPCAQSINLHLRGLGFKEVDFMSSAPADVASVLNVIDSLIRQKHGDQTESSRLDDTVAKLKAENDVLAKELKRAEKKLEEREREIGNLMIKTQRAESAVFTENMRTNRELEQLQGSYKRLSQLHACWQQELRRRERDYTALQDKLRFHLQERKREANKASMELAGLTKEGETRPATRSKRLSGSGEEDMQKKIVEYYEQQKNELVEENSALKRAMLDLQDEYKELLNQLQEGKHPRSYMSMRRLADSIDGSLTSAFTSEAHALSGVSLDREESSSRKDRKIQQVASEAGALIQKSADILRCLGRPGRTSTELADQLDAAHALIKEQQQAMQQWRDLAS